MKKLILSILLGIISICNAQVELPLDAISLPSRVFYSNDSTRVYVGFPDEFIELAKYLDIPTKTSDLTNDGSDETSTYVESSELSEVAFSGSYNDLDNLPTIPAQLNPTAGTGISISGTYPNLTFTNTSPNVVQDLHQTTTIGATTSNTITVGITSADYTKLSGAGLNVTRDGDVEATEISKDYIRLYQSTSAGGYYNELKRASTNLTNNVTHLFQDEGGTIAHLTDILTNVMTTSTGQSYVNFTRAETLIVLTNSGLTINIPNPTTHSGKKVIIKCIGSTTIGVSGAVTDGISDLSGTLTTTVSSSTVAIFISDGTVWQQIQ